MERLTNKREAEQDRRNYQKRMEQGYPRNIPEERFLKLAAYEDTGLEPEEIAQAMEDCADTAAASQWTIKQLAEVGVPPCKIGDSIFCIRNFCGGKRAVPGVVSEMYYTGPEMVLTIVVRGCCRGEWGKIVFPTLEAAEAALKERQEHAKIDD